LPAESIERVIQFMKSESVKITRTIKE